MKLSNYIVNIFIICFGLQLQAQETPAIPATKSSPDSTISKEGIPSDSILNPTSIVVNTSKIDNPKDSIKRGQQTIRDTSKLSDGGVIISKNGLDDIIDYGSKDSSYVDLKENQIHLFGEAFIKYKEFDLKAGYIIFDFDNNEASAFRLKDKNGKFLQKPDFTDGTNKFTSNGLRFNFKTNKGLIYDALTQEGEFTIHGSKTKFVSKDADSTAVDDHIYNEHAILTTCTNPDHPHFGIRARKLKVVPNKLAIIGLSQLEIMGIPTPIVLPFGFFPLVEGRSSGLIFPNNYEYDEQLGIGFREIGYYFPINDYVDLRATGDIYTRGTHRINLRSNYKKRYKYSGNVQLSYSNNIGESTRDGNRTSNKSYSLKVTHNQDAKAHPYRSVGGTINLSTNRFDQTNFNDVGNVVNNRINSNFFYKHSMPGTPFSFSTAFTHFQDNQTRKVDITLPDAKLRMNTIYPFKKNTGGTEKWYERVNVGYDARFRNHVTATDTTLFTDEIWENIQTGISHEADIGMNGNVFKYINLSANANFEQFVLTRIEDRFLDTTLITETVATGFDQLGEETFRIDTTYGMVEESFINGLQTVEKFGLNVSANTQLFATKRFKKGWLRGLRHTMKPSVGFNFSPDTQERYQDSVMVSSNPNEIDEVTFFNPYRGGAFNPTFNQRQMALTYSISNLFEGKYFSKADSTEKKFKLLNSFNVNGNYNFAADSLKFSPLRITGNTSFFKGITNVNFNAQYNFYKTNENGALVNTTIWSESRRPLEFDNFRVTVTNGFTLGSLRELIFPSKDKSGSSSKNGGGNSQREGRNTSKRQDISLSDWTDGFRISHSLGYQIRKQNNGVDTSFVSSHSIQLSGRVPLTDSWNLSVNNISYDLVDKEFVFPQFTLSRDLHCWTMQFSWTPAFEVYSFFIGVKSSTLSFMKYDYGQRNSTRLFGG